MVYNKYNAKNDHSFLSPSFMHFTSSSNRCLSGRACIVAGSILNSHKRQLSQVTTTRA